jgi:hypothetical protein
MSGPRFVVALSELPVFFASFAAYLVLRPVFAAGSVGRRAASLKSRPLAADRGVLPMDGGA